MFNTNGQNLLLASIDTINYVGIHDAIPDATGSDEVSGGAYARQSVIWTSAVAGVRDNQAQIVHEMPAGTTAVCYGFFDAVAAGNHYGHVLIGSTLSGAGTVDSPGVTANAIQSAGHGLSNDDRVAVYAVLSEALPIGLAERVLYYVVGSTTDTYQVSLTQGGAAVDITAQGELWWQDCVPAVFGSAGQLQTAVGDLDLSTTVL